MGSSEAGSSSSSNCVSVVPTGRCACDEDRFIEQSSSPDYSDRLANIALLRGACGELVKGKSRVAPTVKEVIMAEQVAPHLLMMKVLEGRQCRGQITYSLEPTTEKATLYHSKLCRATTYK